MTLFDKLIFDRWWIIPTLAGTMITLYWLFIQEPKEKDDE